jgi:hypothetical protein
MNITRNLIEDEQWRTQASKMEGPNRKKKFERVNLKKIKN